MKENRTFFGGCAVEDVVNTELEEDRMDSSPSSSFDEFLALAEWTIKALKEGELNIQGSLAGLLDYLDHSSADILDEEELHTPEMEEPASPIPDKDYVAGYRNCMNETIRYLIEDEQLSTEDPIVMGLHQHLLTQHQQLATATAAQHQHHQRPDVENIPCGYVICVRPETDRSGDAVRTNECHVTYRSMDFCEQDDDDRPPSL